MAKATGNAGGKARAAAKSPRAATRKAGVQAKAKAAKKPKPATAASPAAQEPANDANDADGDELPDEEELLADVSSIIDPLVRLSESEEREREPAATAAPTPTPAEAAIQAAEQMARQHAEYQRSVELVRQQLAQRHMQQMQQTTQQHLQLQLQQQQQLYQQSGGNVMQHIQQRLQERIQNKQHQQLYDEIRQKAATAVASDVAAKQQLQMQQYHAMIRELEMQATAAAASVGSSSPSPSGFAQAEVERMRQERLQRLHQMQLQKLQLQQQQMQAQQAALRVTLSGIPPITAEQQNQQRTQLHIDHDRLRLLQQQQQSQVQTQQAAPSVEPQANQPTTPSNKTTPNAASKKRPAGQSVSETDAKPAASTVSSTPTTTPTATPPKKKKKTPAESQMEALVRVLCRLHLSKNESEMRSQLDKLDKWIIKCVDVCLLRFALRDFVETFGVKQKQFDKSPTWPTEILPKCTYLHDKLRHTIAALDKVAVSVAETQSAGPTAVPPAKTPTTLKPPGTDSITQAAREHAYAALKEQMMVSLLQPKPRPQPAAKTVAVTPIGVVASAVIASPGSKTAVVTTTMDNEDSTSKAKPDTPAGATSTTNLKGPQATASNAPVGSAQAPSQTVPSWTSTVAAPPRPLSAIPTPRPVPSHLPASTTISPQVAQHLFDLDLAPRTCAVAPDEGEDRFYFPLKSIANMMRKVLPGGGHVTVRRRRRGRRPASEIENGDAAAKKNEDDEEEEDEGEDGDGDGGAEDGDEAETKTGEEEDATKGEKEKASASSAAASAATEPPVKIDDDAVMFMQECVTEFLLFFTSEARDQSTYDKKKGSITGANLVQAMDNLGFAPYAKVLANYNEKVRKIQDEEARQKQERKNLAKQRKLQAEQLQKQQQDQQAAAALQAKMELLAQATAPAAPSSGGE